MSYWNIGLLGQFRATDPEGNHIKYPGGRHEAVIAYLFLSPHKSVSREELIRLLWSTRPDTKAKNSLKSVVHGLNALSRNKPAALLEKNDTGLVVAAPQPNVDVCVLENAGPGSTTDCLEVVSDSTDGHFLESINIQEEEFQEWLENQKRRIAVNLNKIRWLLIERQIGKRQRSHLRRIYIG
jgi:DNA-binding SARP family transcriptional activator